MSNLSKDTQSAQLEGLLIIYKSVIILQFCSICNMNLRDPLDPRPMSPAMTSCVKSCIFQKKSKILTNVGTY